MFQQKVLFISLNKFWVQKYYMPHNIPTHKLPIVICPRVFIKNNMIMSKLLKESITSCTFINSRDKYVIHILDKNENICLYEKIMYFAD